MDGPGTAQIDTEAFLIIKPAAVVVCLGRVCPPAVRLEVEIMESSDDLVRTS